MSSCVPFPAIPYPCRTLRLKWTISTDFLKQGKDILDFEEHAMGVADFTPPQHDRTCFTRGGSGGWCQLHGNPCQQSVWLAGIPFWRLFVSLSKNLQIYQCLNPFFRIDSLGSVCFSVSLLLERCDDTFGSEEPLFSNVNNVPVYFQFSAISFL